MTLHDWFGSTAEHARFLRLVLDHVSDCLVAVDTAGRVMLINQPYCRLLGGNEEDFIGRHITEVVSPHTRLHHVALGEEVVTGAPLEVRGHHLIARQVPVFEGDQIVGAVGLALFSNFDLLQRTYSLASQAELAIRKPKNAWVARYTIDDIVGQGPAMDRLRVRLRQAAAHAHPALLSGETGTGKELAAHAIHSLSDRADKPFVWVNCASIPRELIEAELFGYEGGAFTGARQRGKPGKFEVASGGTLFLDEISDMPRELQASLLRAVQTQEIVRVGGSTPISIDVRIICASNKPLNQLVAEGHFRQDLYYRLSVFDIAIPPLRERDDLEFIANKLLDRLSRREGLTPRPLPPEQMKRLRDHRWPGNIRELEAVLLRWILTGEVNLPRNGPPATAPSRLGERVLNLREALQREKARVMQEALSAANGDKDRAADLLGISRATLYRELRSAALPA